jgi:hypothetical protein
MMMIERDSTPTAADMSDDHPSGGFRRCVMREKPSLFSRDARTEKEQSV